MDDDFTFLTFKGIQAEVKNYKNTLTIQMNKKGKEKMSTFSDCRKFFYALTVILHTSLNKFGYFITAT